LALALVGGCTTSPHHPEAGGGGGRAVERLDLLLTPIALDLDGKPGADGFGARVYASSRRSAVGTILSEGQLEITMYDGVVRPEDLSKAKPLRTWTYSPAELKPHAQKTSIGIGYRFALAWATPPPHEERITVIARYLAPDGVHIPSAPGTIPIALR
jgi:hypothetical protein